MASPTMHKAVAADTAPVGAESAVGFSLARDGFGRLVFTAADGRVVEGVVPVRAFPIGSPHDGVALVGPDGKELQWVARIDALPEATAQHIHEELASREFMPEIKRIVRVSRYATPSTWEVETDRGLTSLVLKGEEDIRRLGPSAYLIADSHGIHFLMRDATKLDKHSRKMLERFL